MPTLAFHVVESARGDVGRALRDVVRGTWSVAAPVVSAEGVITWEIPAAGTVTVEDDVALYWEARELVLRIADASLELEAEVEADIDGELMGTIANGTVDDGIGTGLLAEWQNELVRRGATL